MQNVIPPTTNTLFFKASQEIRCRCCRRAGMFFEKNLTKNLHFIVFFLIILYSLKNQTIMRKIIVCIPILLTLSLTAQIRVDCSGYYPTVGIGTNPQPNFYLTTSSRVKFDMGSYVGLIIDPSAYYALALYPTTNNHGNIGRSDRAFREIWAYNYSI